MANDKWSGSNPWLGLAPYTEGTPLYGRTKESIQLSDIIKDNMASVVFGKSGIGKSSLLSAGISPLLREENYIPVRIRLVHNTDVSYIEQIETKVRETVKCIDRLPSDVDNLGLWDFFHRHSFTTESGIDCIPVIILDQFEEIYTLTDAEHKKDIVAFFNELSSLLNDIKPDNVIEEEQRHSIIQNGFDTATPKRGIIKRSAASALNYTSATTFRFVICLREDKLYLLERNSANIPSLKANRYNLQALSPDSALEVIMCPRPELFSNEEATAIVDKLADMGDEGIQTIDPAILSLFLYKYYEKKGEANYDNIFADYYQEATKDIKGKSIAFLEDHLLTLGGYRNQVPLDDALSSGVTQEDIQSLLQSIIIRKEQRKGIDYIEFSHDRLCTEAVKSRNERVNKEQAKKVRRRMMLSFLIFAISVAILSVVLWLTIKLDKETAGRHSAEVANDSITRLNNEKELQLHLNELQRDSIEKLNKDLSNEKETLNQTLIDREGHIAIIERQKHEIEVLMSGAEIDSMSITNNKAGYLSKNLPFATLTKLSKLTISGELNGSDLYHLNAAFKGNLKYLNLRDAKIVAGGISYYNDHKTENNVIGLGLFRDSKSLENVIIPNNVTSIGSGAFSRCSGLRSINIPNSVTSIGVSAFFNCSSLASVNIPNSVTSIGNSAFAGCSGLISINIPNSVKSIGDWAFKGCSGLTSINIPNSVKSIGDYAFEGCSSLTFITSEVNDINKREISESAFSMISSTCTWHVPVGKSQEYTSRPWWVETWNIVDDLR